MISIPARACRRRLIRFAHRAAISTWLLSGQLQAQPEAVSPGLPERSGAVETRYAPVPCQAGQEFFQDVPASSPFCRWIEQLARDGLSAGCGDGKFCPQGVVTRQQLAVILERVLQDVAPRRQLDVSPRHSCVLLPSGRLECWGGFGDESIPPAESFSSVSAGLNHTCGVTRDGLAICWPAGVPAPPARTFLSVSAGYNHDCGVLADRTVACWGSNEEDEATPPSGETFSSVSAGGTSLQGHTCGVRTDGTLSCWGYWQWKEPTPTGKFLAVSAGGRHTCGLRLDGTVACFGNNDSGQSTAPAGVFLSVSAGDTHTCGVREDGTVACWGSHSSGPTPPAGQFSSVSSGQGHNCGTRVDGAVVCWGASGWGAETPPAWLQ